MDKKKTPYTLRNNDRLVFSVKKGCDYQEKLIYIDNFVAEKKEAKGRTYYVYTFSLNADDTKDLDFGNYVYDIILYFANGEVDTVIDTSLFRVHRAVGS